jgi:PIN domain nuclease of toxin-antitoxin system
MTGISPMVVVELTYLFELQRIILKPAEIVYKLNAELQAAVAETWTRDPFDRLIVSHAKANGRAGLISKDEIIAQHYRNTIW